MTRKTALFERWSWFKFNNLGLARGTNLQFYTSVAKGLVLKTNFYVCRSYRGKTGRGPFAPPPILNRVKLHIFILSLVYFSFLLGSICKYCVSVNGDTSRLNLLSANPTKWSNTLKKLVSCCRRIVCVCLNILWGSKCTNVRYRKNLVFL